MNNKNSDTAVVIVSIFVILFIIAAISGGSSEPRCDVSTCNNERAEGSDYCYLHKGSIYDRSYRYKYTPTKINKSSYSYGTSNTSSYKKSSGSYSKSTSSYSSSSRWNSYDSGYDDIYDNEDYDRDRYDRDSEYADGVDDAMDELNEDY